MHTILPSYCSLMEIASISKRRPTKTLLLGRPYVVTGGLLFYPWFFFISPRVLRGRSADRRETWPHDRKLSEFYNPSPKIRGGPSPNKIWGQKHAKFRSILCNLRLWSRISPERLKISKIGKLLFQIDSFCVLRKRSRELWPTNYRDLAVSLDPLKCTFWGYYISAISGCCALKFLHALHIDQPLLAHTRTGRGSPKKF